MTQLTPESLLVFTVAEQQFAIAVSSVEKVVQAVELAPSPGAAPPVCGEVNVHGSVFPVVDLRMRLAMPPRDLQVTDHLIITRTPARGLALLVDAVDDVVPCPEGRAATHSEPEPFADGAVKLPDGLVLIDDLERFLSMSGRDPLPTGSGA